MTFARPFPVRACPDADVPVRFSKFGRAKRLKAARVVRTSSVPPSATSSILSLVSSTT